MLDILGSGRGATRANDAQGTPTQSHISPSIQAYEESATDPARNCYKLTFQTADRLVILITPRWPVCEKWICTRTSTDVLNQPPPGTNRPYPPGGLFPHVAYGTRVMKSAPLKSGLLVSSHLSREKWTALSDPLSPPRYRPPL